MLRVILLGMPSSLEYAYWTACLEAPFPPLRGECERKYDQSISEHIYVRRTTELHLHHLGISYEQTLSSAAAFEPIICFFVFLNVRN